MIIGAREGGLKSILISQERRVGTSLHLLSSRLLTSEANRWALVSIIYNLPSHTLNQSIINKSRPFVIDYLFSA